MEHVKLTNLTVRTTHSYNKKIGHISSPVNIRKIMMAHMQGRVVMDMDVRESIRIVRYLVERKPGKQMPDTHLIHSQLSNMKREADYETREYLTVGMNNYGDFLLEIPSKPRNTAVAEKFLQWLDGKMLDIPVRNT